MYCTRAVIVEPMSLQDKTRHASISDPIKELVRVWSSGLPWYEVIDLKLPGHPKSLQMIVTVTNNVAKSLFRGIFNVYFLSSLLNIDTHGGVA